MRYTWSNSVTEEDQKNSGVLKPVTLGMGRKGASIQQHQLLNLIDQLIKAPFYLINSINEDPTIFKSLVIFS